MRLTPTKTLSARKSLCLFTNILNVNNKTAKLLIEDIESKLRAIKVGTSLWTKKKNEKGL